MLVRTKLRCWLWGLLPLLAIGVLVVWLTEDRIEQDLTQRSVVALRDAGIDWARPEFSGRDGSINGEAPSVDERLKAIEVVRQVYGVRRVEDRLSLKRVVSPFTWSGSHRKSKLRLKGFVPSSQLKSSIGGLVKAKFPQVDIDDELEVARGAPDPQKWFGQVSYSIGLLSRLSEGQVSLVDNKLSISGAARDEAAYKALLEGVSNGLPLDLVKGAINILPPVVETFFFTAKHDAKSLTLSGVVPSTGVKDSLLNSAKAKFPDVEIDEKISIGSGAPSGWQEALMLSLSELAKLETGDLKLNKFDVQLDGLAADTAVADGVRRTVRAQYPTGYKVDDDIKVKAPELPIASPFTFTLFQAADTMVLKGYVKSEEQRQRFLARLASLFPTMTIDDQLSVAKGAPVDFGAAFMSVIDLLPKLENGRLEIIDTDLTLSGMSADRSFVDGFVARPQALPEGFEWIGKVSFDDSQLKAEEAKAAQEAEDKRLAAEKAEAETLAAEKAAEEARLAKEALLAKEAEAARLAAEKAEAEAAEKAKAEAEAARIEAEKAEAKKAEEERLAAEKAEEERMAALKAEEEKAKTPEKEVTSEEELAEKRKWLTPNETEKRLDTLYKESAAVNAKECQLLMNSIVRGSAIRFGVNSSVIKPDSYEVLKKVETVASRCTNTIIRIEGHTDSDGSEGYNLELSKRRAQAVINYLTKNGIPLERLDAKGNGEKKPVASNATSKGKALNRRIEFVVFEN